MRFVTFDEWHGQTTSSCVFLRQKNTRNIISWSRNINHPGHPPGLDQQRNRTTCTTWPGPHTGGAEGVRRRSGLGNAEDYRAGSERPRRLESAFARFSVQQPLGNRHPDSTVKAYCQLSYDSASPGHVDSPSLTRANLPGEPEYGR